MLSVGNGSISDVRRGRVTRLVRSIGAVALDVAWPTRCVGCDAPGTLMCDGCRESLPWVEQRLACPSCGAPYGWLTCTECERDWETRAVVCALSFEDAAARLITCYKDEHELRLAPVLSAALLTALDEASDWPARDGRARFSSRECDGVCFVPATPAAYSRRGFDHMEPIAAAVAAEYGLPLADVLVRSSAQDQRRLGRRERIENLRGSVGVVDDVSGMRLLLVDDVVTTGASVRVAARALLARGAASVTACAVARVW